MDDLVTGNLIGLLIARVARYIAVSIRRRQEHLLRVSIENLESKKEELISTRDLVRRKVEATSITEEVGNALLEWLNEVKKLLEEVDQFEKKRDIDDGFSQTTYHIVKMRRLHRQMRNKMDNKIDSLRQLNTLLHQFEPFPFLAQFPDIEYFSSENFVSFKSTKMASDQLLEALQDDSSYVTGLYGMRGSGKTTLVKAVGKKVKYLKIFDLVVFATVSQNPNVKRIQDEIADWLGLKFDENSETGRARRISTKLESKERILVILDDVWAKVELEDIGIPCNGNNHKCKVLLTTRLQSVCTLMNCQREIPLHLLSEEEAWMLFKKHSGIDHSSSPNLSDMARQVAIECKGLPIAIEEVGSSLKRKHIDEWKAALDSLKYSMARYHVFLSFRGADTRYSFTGTLYRALCQEGFKTFMDDEVLEGGDQISLSLIEAIQASRLSIIVFSENYAQSSWCLDELVNILECMNTNNQLVWPIFYKVNPADVWYQQNSYARAMAAHENRLGNDSEKVQKWKSALNQVANLKGWHFDTGYEYEFVEKMVEMVLEIKNRLYIQRPWWSKDYKEDLRSSNSKRHRYQRL